jgi:iron(III) transport system ATP-binding protein
MSNSAALQLENVSHFFDEHQVLNSVNLHVDHGSITALLGPSGGGKTTLLRIVAGFERPTGGTVSINGTVVADAHTWIPTRERGVAIVPQEGALFPHLSVGENIAFGLKKRRSIQTQNRVAEMLELVGLPDAANAMPSDLSGGMQQRIALARALATNPALVLLDEPFSALDAGLREALREQVVTILRRAGATAIWVTHDQDEALSTADSVAVLMNGSIAQLSAPTSVYRLPETLDVANFIGETVSIPGVVASDQKTVTTRFGTSELIRDHSVGPVTVLIRPEQFEIVSHEHTAASVIGNVVDTRYFGHDGTVDVRFPDGLLAKVRLHARLLPEIGTDVGVVINGAVLAFEA